MAGKVLVAEDNEVSQQVARRLLEAIGCTVVVVQDGEAAVSACARQVFGLVLMDLQMPKMDGLQAAREIRRRERPGRHVPILALTASCTADELARCIAAGMNGLLTKPLEIPLLRQTLTRYGLLSRTLELQQQTPADAQDPPEAPRDEPVDLMTLHAKSSGDPGSVRRLCQTFVTTTAQSFEELAAAVASGERTRVRHLVHRIRSGGSGVYAHRLAAIAANIESAAMTAPLPDLAAAAETLRQAFEEARRHIESHLP